MSAYLLDEADVQRYIRSMLNSRDWWTIPVVSRRVSDFCTHVETNHYAGEANADFIVVLTPALAAPAVAFFHKRRLPAPRLARVLHDLGCAWPSETMDSTIASLAKRDVLIIAASDDTGDLADAAVRSQLWHDWVIERN